MLTYQKACEFIGRKDRRKLCYQTYAEHIGNGCIGIKFHSTYIIKIYPDGTHELNHGGYPTYTTKKRINKYSPIRIYQRDFNWYYSNDKPFINGMKVR